MAIGIGPGLFAGSESCCVSQALARDQVFQRRQPVFVIVRAIVGLSAIGRSPQLFGKRSSPFLPGEVTFFRKAHGETEGLSLPRFGKGWSVLDRKSVV